MLILGVQTFLIFFLTFMLTMSVVQWWRGRQMLKRYPGYKLPPGPRGFPLVGSIFSLGRNPHLTFMEMAKKYGDVFTINLAGQNVLVVNGFEAVREALVKQSTIFAGRPHLALTQELTEGQGKLNTLAVLVMCCCCCFSPLKLQTSPFNSPSDQVGLIQSP